MRKIFIKAKDSTLSACLSVARNSIPLEIKEDQKFSKVTEEEIEKAIIEKLNNRVDNANINLAINFLKIKRADAGLDDDLDIESYLKKVLKSK